MGTTSGPAIRCTVEGAEKLPRELGGSDGVCATITRALAAKGIDAESASVTVEVKSDSIMSATATIAGRAFPAQTVGVSDRSLNPRAVEMLAAAVAGQVE